MAFNTLQIRYQTARSLPAPYAYFYTLTLRPVAGDALQVDLAITYPNRDNIDDDELIAEGYTRDDDFSWSGRLPKTWGQTIADIVGKTRLQPGDEASLGEDDDFWDVRLELGTQPTQGEPANADDWQYMVQELIQAAYESTHRERPFELTYLELGRAGGDAELHLKASFAERAVQVTQNRNGQKRTDTQPWSVMQRVMNAVYSHDYDPDEAQAKRPKQAGHWLNLGNNEWYDIGPLKTLTAVLSAL